MAYLKEKLPAVETPLRVCTLEHLAAWLATQPVDKSYCWTIAGKCLFGRYGRAFDLGRNEQEAYENAVKGFGIFEYDQPQEPCGIARTEPHTYGAALARTLAAIA